MTPDLSKLSDDDFEKLQRGDLTNLSDEGLAHLTRGTSDTNPAEADLYGSDVTRMKSGFADPRSQEALVNSAGAYRGAHHNAAGELVAQAPDNTYVKDSASFMKHPVNWAESHLKDALPLAGMAGGGLIGGSAGPVGAIVTAGGGAALGQAGNHALGRAMGVYKPDASSSEALQDVKQAGLEGLAAEGGGKALGALGGNWLAGKALGGLRRGAAGISSTLTGLDYDALVRLMERPKEMMGDAAPVRWGKNLLGMASDEGATPLGAGREIDTALTARDQKLGQAVGSAKAALAQSSGEKTLSTNAQLTQFYAQVDQAAKDGLISAERALELKAEADKILTTTEHIPGEGAHTPVEPGLVPTGEYGELTPGLKPSGPTQFTKPPESVQVPAATFDQLNHGMGQTSPRSADGLPARYYQSKGAVPQSGDTATDLIALLRKGVREASLSGKSPEAAALGEANLKLSNFKDDAALLKGAQKEGGRENFTRNLGGAGKTEQREALERSAPEAVPAVEDVLAKQKLEAAPIFPEDSLRRILMGGVGFFGGGGTAPWRTLTTNPLRSGMTGSALLSMSPKFNRAMAEWVGGRIPNTLLPQAGPMAVKELAPWHLLEDPHGK